MQDIGKILVAQLNHAQQGGTVQVAVLVLVEMNAPLIVLLI
jgi:hypothetical protein